MSEGEEWVEKGEKKVEKKEVRKGRERSEKR